MENQINPFEKCHKAEDVDEATGLRIGQLFGSIDEEFKMHREAILAMATLMWGNQGSMTVERAKEKVKGLLQKNEEIERIIEEGKKFKRLKGWE